MATTVIVKNESTRKVILAALWEHLAAAEGKIDGFGDGLYDLVCEGFRPEATDANYRAARARFDDLLAFLTNARRDVEHVETAPLGTTVVLEAITPDESERSSTRTAVGSRALRRSSGGVGRSFGRTSSPATMRSPR